MGRPSKYKDTFPESLLQHFSIPLYRREIIKTYHKKDGSSEDTWGEVSNDPPFFSDWCASVGITQAILDEWVNEKSKYFKPELFVTYKRAKDLQKQFISINGMRGNFNPAMSIFTLKNISEWRDQNEPSILVNQFTQIWNAKTEKANNIDETGRIKDIGIAK